VEIPRSRKNLTALTVLALIAETPRHPYEMLGLIRERRKDFATGLPRSLYHAIDRLHESGFIEPVETSREGRRPERTVYRITQDGQEELESWLAELTSTVAKEHPLFSAAMSFWPLLAPQLVAHLLYRRAAVLEGEIAAIDAQLRAIGDELPRIVLVEEEFTRAMRKAELDWVRKIASEIASGELAMETGTSLDGGLEEDE